MRVTRIENGLLPSAILAGSTPQIWTMSARMAHYKVPGVSIAVIDHGAVAWARGYGLARAGTSAPVTADTLFQAASISKSLTAAAALLLVDEGRLALDANVNDRLASWKIRVSPVAQGEFVTLRQLLSHTAGLTIHGFAGYPAGATLPTLGQILDGSPPANSSPIRVFLKPGTTWRYSGGGYCVVQQLLTDVTGERFEKLLHDRVLAPTGMGASTFEQPLSSDLILHAAAGHRNDGAVIAGDAHVYPELAAAGLWTTPTDLARFLLAIQHSLEGRPGFLNPATAEAMLSVPLTGSDYGLGLGVKGTGEKLQLAHSGANEGFCAQFVAYPRTGQGAVIMTNSDNGGAIVNEIMRAIAREYGWPDFQVVEKASVPLSPAAFDTFAGRYERDDVVLRFSRTGDRFYVRASDQPKMEIFPQSSHEFFLISRSEIYDFQQNEAGQVTHVIRRNPTPQVFHRTE